MKIKMSELLKETKKNLALDYADFDIKPRYICNAATRSSGEIIGGRVVKLMRSRLNNHYAVENFLTSIPKVCIALDKLSDETRKDQIQKYRHRWVDSLIVEFKAKGD